MSNHLDPPFTGGPYHPSLRGARRALALERQRQSPWHRFGPLLLINAIAAATTVACFVVDVPVAGFLMLATTVITAISVPAQMDKQS